MRSSDDLDDVTRPHGPQGDWAVGVDPMGCGPNTQRRIQARNKIWTLVTGEEQDARRE